MREPSGAAWCKRFPTSALLGDLVNPFRDNVGRFVQAIRDGGASVTISATYRPAERAYLMHWSCMIGNGGQDPAEVPAMAGVDIDWTRGGDRTKAKAGAREMMAGYNIAFPAALVSRHTQRRAVDMTVHFPHAIMVKDAKGVAHATAATSDLIAIGETYGVKKLASDPPHWSDDGH